MWNTIRVYYHQTNKTNLLLDCINPIIIDLKSRKLISAFYFVRHWIQGPHIRMNFKCEPNVFEEIVSPLVNNRLSEYIQKYPSETYDEEKLKKHHEQLALMEMETETSYSFLPNNSIRVTPYDNNIGVDIIATQFTERYYVETFDLVIELIQRSRGDSTALFSDLIKIMVASIAIVKDVRRSYLSFRSHAESMFNVYDVNGQIRQKFDKQYNDNKSHIKNLIIEIMKQIDGKESAGDSLFTDWLNFISKYFEDLYPMFKEGREMLPSNESLSAFYQERGIPEKWGYNEYSEFHQILYSRENIEKMFEEPLFHALRLVLKNLYLTFSQVGIKPIERFYLAYLVANGIEDLYEIDWRDQVLKTE